MGFHTVFVSSTSACFELENQAPYYAPDAFDVSCNGVPALTGVAKNVFSLFNLRPDTDYTVAIGGDTVQLHTASESACINVLDFGAKGDGRQDDTLAIQTAILACPENGRVFVPAGTYHILPLTFKSHMTFELSQGATLLAETVESRYPIWPGEIDDVVTGEKVQISSFEGTPMPCYQSILNAHHAKDVTIIGQGIVDGNAQNSTWWLDHRNRTIGRPQLMFFNQCTDVNFHGITGRNSPSWNIHPFFSKNLGFYDMAVEAPKDSPNTDGTDPESCDNVEYVGVRFSVGDDAIAIKAGKMYMGMKYQTPATRHTIRNCLMEYAHGGVVLGSEMSGGIKDLTVSQCLFTHTDRGLRIKTRRGRGKYAVIDGVTFENIRMENVLTPLVINMFYFCDPDGKTEYVWSKEKLPVDDGTPYLGSFTFKDVTCIDCEWAAGYFYGLPEQPVGSVRLENVSFDFKKDASSGHPAMMSYIDECSKLGLYFNNVKSVSLHNVTMSGQDGERVMLHNVDAFDED